MPEALSSWLHSLPLALVGNIAQVLFYPIDPVQRVYWLYLLSSGVFALFAWRARRRSGEGGGFWRFCFPREVWSHPSAWLDVRYFLVHQTVFRVWLYGALVVSISLATATLLLGPGLDARATPASALERAVLTLAAIALVDLTGFLSHVLQHRIPWLWEFHRVHHSPPVLHPLSNYREHPVDNLLYAVGNGAALGTATSGAAVALGCPLATVDVLGVNSVLFAFDFLGYHLRHSHIWVRWPCWLEQLLGSPAYHQIHHSVDPRHRDRNFAFIFPIWDRLLGTQVLPREPETLTFGLGDGTEAEYDSIFKLYALPFARLARGRRADVLSPASCESRPSPS